jgi:hypothetical protein
MTNKSNLLNNLSSLQSLETAVWASFVEAEKKARIEVWQLQKLFRIRAVIANESNYFVRNCPYFLLLTAVFAVASAFSHIFFPNHDRIAYWSLLLIYGIFLVLAMFNYDKFLKTFVQHEQPRGKQTYKAFELKNASLLVHYLFEGIWEKKPEARLNKANLDNLIKLVKSSQDYSNTQYGYYDYGRKGFVAIIMTAPYTAWPAVSKVVDKTKLYWPKARDFFSSEDYLAKGIQVLWLIAALCYAAYILYWVSFGGPRSEMRRKRYLLALTALQCCWEE